MPEDENGEAMPRRLYCLTMLDMASHYIGPQHGCVSCPGHQPAQANPVQDLIERQSRPELDKDQAIVMMMDAKSRLSELSLCAILVPCDKQHHFSAHESCMAHCQCCSRLAICSSNLMMLPDP